MNGDAEGPVPTAEGFATTETVTVDMLASIQTELGQLSDLFRRRLLEDRAKNDLIETVQEQARAAQERLNRRDVEGLFRELLLAVDRLHDGPPSERLNASVADEILDVLRRRELAEVDAAGAFDPRVHEVVATVETGDVLPSTITAVERRGFSLAGRLLRPARVTIAVAPHERSA